MSIKDPEIITFHFKMDILMMDKLTDLALFQKIQNLSGTINIILMQLFTIIEKIDMNGIQRFSRYEFINEDKSIERKHVFVKIPDFLYRRLKCLHDVLNYYSIAQLLRALIRLFLDMVSRFGDGYGEELMRLTNTWVSFSRNSQFLIKYINQLIMFEGEISEIIKKFSIYTIHYSPYRVFRL
jgi:hypothetical protein